MVWKYLAIAPIIFALHCAAEPYVTCQIQSQLGNQIFEIATVLATAWEHGATPVFPELKKTECNIPLTAKKIFFRLSAESPNVQWNYFRLSGLAGTSRVYYQPIPYQPNLYIDGWNWQTAYFDKYKERLIETFAPSEEENAEIEAKYGDLLRTKNLVAVHVRAYNPEFFYFIGFDYFKRAMDLFPEDSTFAIFSCRIEYAKRYLAGYKRNMVFIEGNDNVRDFFLMNKCKHHIISNSSFSFWAAYLKDDKEQIVIAPDLYNPPLRFTVENGAYPKNWKVLKLNYERPHPEIRQFPTQSIHGG